MIKKFSLVFVVLMLVLTVFSCTEEEDSSPAMIDVSVESLSFGDVQIGQTSEPQTITITNHGETALELHEVTIEPEGNFMLEGDLPNTIYTGGSKEINVVFAPTEVMEYSATLTIKTNAENYPTQQVALSGSYSDLDLLASWMTGDFSSEAQADTSSDPYHYAVSMKMVRIWHERTDGYWLYIEQAQMGEDPYRQRIYHVMDSGDQLMDEIYRMPNPDQYVGNWSADDTSIFDTLSVETLEEADGCEVYFDFDMEANMFVGGTQGENCESSIPGVVYITSDVEVTETYLSSWDLGYNANGDIVMGPYSPYIFDKLEDWSPLYSD